MSEIVDDNSLIKFLKDNEYLFTILGVFLVLAFIFNSPQLINFANPQSQSMNLQCSINGTLLINQSPNSITQINCTSKTTENAQLGSNSGFYSNSARAFAFICLLMALIVYLVICYNLYRSLRNSIGKIPDYFKKSTNIDEIKQDWTILFIIPFFYQGLIWFVELLFSLFPDMMANAFFSTTLTFLLIEFFTLIAIISEVYRKFQNSKSKIFALSCLFFIVAIIFVIIAIFQNDLIIFLTLGMVSIVFIIFGIQGMRRYIKIRDIIEVHEVI